MGFSEKKLAFSEDIKVAKLPYDATGKNPQNVQSLRFLSKKHMGFSENDDFSFKSLNVSKMPWNATEIVKTVKTFKNGFSKKTDRFLERNREIF